MITSIASSMLVGTVLAHLPPRNRPHIASARQSSAPVAPTAPDAPLLLALQFPVPPVPPIPRRESARAAAPRSRAATRTRWVGRIDRAVFATFPAGKGSTLMLSNVWGNIQCQPVPASGSKSRR